MFNWLNKLKFWKKKAAKPVTVVLSSGTTLEVNEELKEFTKNLREDFQVIEAELIKEEKQIEAPQVPEPDWEKIIVDDWNAQAWPTPYFGNPEAAGLVDAFKQRLIQNYNMVYLSSGGCSNVYVNKKRTFVVKIAQVYSPEPIPYSNYLSYAQSEDGLRHDLPIEDAKNWREIQRIRRNHVLYPRAYGVGFGMCTMRFIENCDLSTLLIQQYFDRLVSNYQLHSLRRSVSWRDIAPINNMAWDKAEGRAYIIDI